MEFDFGGSVVPAGDCSSARQPSMADSPPRAIHGPLCATPGRHNAPLLKVRDFFERAILDLDEGTISKLTAADWRPVAAPSTPWMACARVKAG